MDHADADETDYCRGASVAGGVVVSALVSQGEGPALKPGWVHPSWSLRVDFLQPSPKNMLHGLSKG